jgi:hypothetical protein
MTTQTFTKMAPPAWLLAMWKEIDDKTFGKRVRLFCGKRGLQSRRRRLAWARDDPQQSARLRRHGLHRLSRGDRILGQPVAQDLSWHRRNDIRRSRHDAQEAFDVPLLLHGQSRSIQGRPLDRSGGPHGLLEARDEQRRRRPRLLSRVHSRLTQPKTISQNIVSRPAKAG